MKNKSKIISAVALSAAAYAGAIHQAANEIMPEDSSANRSDVIYAANEARFTSSNYSEALTGYIVGYADKEDLWQQLERFFPTVNVSRRFEFKKAANAEALLSETDDVRAIGSAFKRVEYTGTSTNEKTLNKGLTTRIDKDDMLEGAEEQAVARLAQRLARNEIRRGFALLTAGATNLAKTWGSSANPDGDVRDSIELGRVASGIPLTHGLYTQAAWNLRLSSLQSSTAPALAMLSLRNEQQLAGDLGLDLVERVTALYQSAAATKSSVMTASTVLLYAAMKGISKDDPSNVKRFVTPTGGGKFRVYREEHDKWIDLTVEHYSNIVITSTTGIRQITAS